MSGDTPEYGPGPADPYKVKEFWKDVVVPAARLDPAKLEKMPTVKATSARGRDIARKQNYEITRRSYGSFHDNYDRISWDHSMRDKTA